MMSEYSMAACSDMKELLPVKVMVSSVREAFPESLVSCRK